MTNRSRESESLPPALLLDGAVKAPAFSDRVPEVEGGVGEADVGEGCPGAGARRQVGRGLDPVRQSRHAGELEGELAADRFGDGGGGRLEEKTKNHPRFEWGILGTGQGEGPPAGEGNAPEGGQA